MFKYQQTQQYFAQVAGGLEEFGAEELSQLNARNVQPAFRGIFFEADREALYRINYCSRLLTRILAPLIKFPCYHSDVLYKKAKSIDWTNFFSEDHTFAVFANISHSRITHSQYAALRLKDAIVDGFRERFDRRPNVEKTNPDIWINLHIENNHATISLDTSGGSLHRRGYRKKTVEAPMQETVAAAIIRYAKWDGSRSIYDPMCGSGTLLSEALMTYCHIPAGYLRRQFGFEFLPDFDNEIWQSVKRETDQQIRELPKGLIAGSDISAHAVKITRANSQCLPSGNRINTTVMDFQNIQDLENRTIVCNPPYGIRLGKKQDVGKLYKAFGDFLKQRCQSSTTFIYFGKRELLKYIGLKPSWKKNLENGGLDGRLAKFEIY